MLQIIGHDSPRFTIHDASLRTKLLLQDRQNAAVLAALDADGNKLQLGRELRVHVWILATASEKYAHLLEHWPPSVVQSLAMALVPGAPAETIPRLLDMLYTEELPPDLDWWDLLVRHGQHLGLSTPAAGAPQCIEHHAHQQLAAMMAVLPHAGKNLLCRTVLQCRKCVLCLCSHPWRTSMRSLDIPHAYLHTTSRTFTCLPFHAGAPGTGGS